MSVDAGRDALTDVAVCLVVGVAPQGSPRDDMFTPSNADGRRRFGCPSASSSQPDSVARALSPHRGTRDATANLETLSRGECTVVLQKSVDWQTNDYKVSHLRRIAHGSDSATY